MYSCHSCYLWFLSWYCLQDHVKIAVVVCQKRHKARFVFEDQVTDSGNPIYLNPCPGVVVDAYGGDSSGSAPHSSIPPPTATALPFILSAAVTITSSNYEKLKLLLLIISP